jgi:TRAP-type C4-dicarboxylate transport system substrate-binding protein
MDKNDAVVKAERFLRPSPSRGPEENGQRTRTERTLRRVALALSALLIAATACGGGENKAGGSIDSGPTVLTFANITSGIQPQVSAFADAVERLSEGSIDIEFEDDWRGGVPESVTIEDVRNREVDMAWVGARAFDDFNALLAPLLVDSYEVEGEVFAAGIPARMMHGFGEPGLVGIVMLPGPMHKVLGVDHPFVRPSDFEGQVVGSHDSDLARATMQALGAIPRPVVAQQALDGLDGLQNQLASIQGNRYYEAGADFVTANLNLWPRPLVVFMNAEAFGELPDEQQAILHEAGENTVDAALEASRAEDAGAGPILCGAGMTVVEATESDLARMRAALDPVYDELESDPQTKAYLDEIRALKEKIAAPAESFACKENGGSPGPASRTATPIDGVYETSFTRDDLANSPLLYDPGEINDENWGDWSWEFDRGEYILTQENAVTPLNSEVGTYKVEGDVITLYRPHDEGLTFACRWSLFRNTLTIDRDDSIGICPTHFLVKPWNRQP